jgi:glycosyltransferase involved in cell wall biosynthesis
MREMNPKVSFVVPCFKLAHLLAECVSSILSQTYDDFEIIIMDDCSPDNTGDVAQSFTDPRVKYVRNEINLGHLRNYNEGIRRSRGEYIWLISADDRLRTPYVLQRYVNLMDAKPEIGFAFCAGIALENGQERGIVKWAAPESQDMIFDGRSFLRRLIDQNCVLAPSALARRSCYETISMFPLDLPFAGDWYLWCVFALRNDVAYFAEPMVNYRMHDQGMTNVLIDKDISILSKDDLAVRWRLKKQIEEAGFAALAEQCEDKIVGDYVGNLTSRLHQGTKAVDSSGQRYIMTFAEFQQSLAANTTDQVEKDRIRQRVVAGIGGHFQATLFKGARTPGRWFGYARRMVRNPRLILNYLSLLFQQSRSSATDR